MVDPYFHSSSPLPSPSPSSKRIFRTTIEDDGASSAMILGDCRALSGKRNNSASFLRMLLVITTVVSTFVVVLAAGGNGGVFIRDTPSLLRRGYSEADVGITVSDPSALAFRRPRRISRYLEETNVDDNTTVIDTDLCDLEYCQTAFVKESLCPEEAPEKSFIASVPIFVQILILVVLLSFSALFSGLTLGLMSLDITGLEIVMAGDDPDAARYAETIYPLRKQGNLLLCTLLLGNVAVNSLMAIFTAAIFNGTIGFVSSTFLIVIFGEIIPQALVSTISHCRSIHSMHLSFCCLPSAVSHRYFFFISNIINAIAVAVALAVFPIRASNR